MISFELAALLLGEDQLSRQADAAAVESALRALVAAGQAAWPSLPLDPKAIAGYLKFHIPVAGDAIEWLRSVQAADLHLACAAAHGVPSAIEIVDRDQLRQMPAWLSRLRASGAFIDDVRQALRERLFVAAPGARPKIADYAGRGALASWLRVSAVRLAIDIQRHDNVVPLAGGEQHRNEAPPLGSALEDPERDWLKKRYRAAFEEAFRGAVAGLGSEQKNLLALHFVDGLTLEQVADLFHVHRATAARWIASARQAIFEGARRRLHERWGVTPAEFDSIAGLVRSQLDMSIAGLLRAPP